MTFENKTTGDVLEVPPPDVLGQSVVKLNGRVVEHVLYSDENGGTATTGDGRTFTSYEWARYITRQLATGAWNEPEASA